jgi:hypothetical protein
MSVPEVLEVARTARRLLTSARALTAADLALPDATIPPQAEVDPPLPAPPAPDPELPFRLEKRATDAVTAFRGATLDLQRTLPTGTPPPPPEVLDQAIDPELLRPRLLRLAGFGIPGAVPTEPLGATPTVRRTLRLQAESVAREAAARVDRLDALDAAYRQAGPATPAAQAYHLARLQEVFGAQFRVLPRFLPANGPDLRQALDGAPSQGATAAAAITWFQRVSRVREGAARLDATLLYGETLGGNAMGFAVAQLPFRSADRWLALDRIPLPVPGGRLSLALHAPAGLDPAQPVCGLLVDEWTEVIPSAEETTGVAFHYDTPASRAPQAVLLAVPPDGARTWSLNALAATVQETLDLVRMRGVDLTTLAAAGPVPGLFLPAIYLATPASGEPATVDRSRVAGPPS